MPGDNGDVAVTAHSCTSPPLSSGRSQSQGGSGFICLWHTADWTRLARLPVEGGTPICAHPSSDGLLLAVDAIGNSNLTVRVWQRASLKSTEFSEVHTFAMQHRNTTDLMSRERKARCVLSTRTGRSLVSL